MNLAAIIESHDADRTALISRGKVTTYGELREQVASLRGGLAGLGLEPGDRVGIAAGNNWYFVVSYFAVLGAGMVAVPLNPADPPMVLTSQLSDVGARGLVFGPSARASVESFDAAALPELTVLVGCGLSPEGGADIDDLVRAEPAPLVDRDPEDLAALLFTSGTAGLPKAAMLTHRNLLSNLELVQETPARALVGDDVALGILPLFHIFGLNVVLDLALLAGASVVLIERFDPLSAAESVRHHGVTVVTGPPTMWTAWAQLPEIGPEHFASLRIAVSGAARLHPEIPVAVRDRLGLELDEGYGLTETSPTVTTSIGTDAPVGSVGRPLAGIDIRLVDEDGDDVPVGDEGEIWVRGPNVFAGYWNDPAATGEALTGDGWLRTGDVAVVDDDGYLFLVDRAKDLIIVSGFNVFPAEVEKVVREHPAVADCAVVGVPHPYSGEAVKAYVAVRPGSSIEEDDVISFCAQRLPRYKCPEKVWFVDELPTGLGGKVLRRELRGVDQPLASETSSR